MLKYRIIIAAVALTIAAGGGYTKGRYDERLSISRGQTAAQTQRADTNAKQRDIANAAPASLDAMLEWLQRGGGDK